MRYLAQGVDAELQQGAISALGDMPATDSARALITALKHATPQNRRLVIEALMRNDGRRDFLLGSVEKRVVTAAEPRRSSPEEAHRSVRQPIVRASEKLLP